VCELIEGSALGAAVPKPPGILSILDDVCATMHAAKQARPLGFGRGAE
jgi:hypothetical protein